MRKVSFLILAVFICSCSHRMIETSLYFAQSRPDGSLVTAEEWSKFKETYVLAVFKKGATAIPVSGNWYDPDKSHLISESTYVVMYLHKPSAALSREIDNLREEYKKQFSQQSVMRIDKKVTASF